MTKIIVTGASGFIGSHLMKRLPPGAKAVHHDDVKYGIDADKLFFLSTYGNMAHHVINQMMVKANVLHLMLAMNKFNGWLCYLSSSSVTLPVQTPYSRTKRAAEEILQALPELKSCIVRPYSVTGVGEQKEHLIPTLIRSCMEDEVMPFDPDPVHDFIDVEDLVDGLIRLSEQRATGIFEFGSGLGYPNRKVKELVEIICGRKAVVNEQRNLRPYDNLKWMCLTPTFKPKKTLEQSITEMVEAYKREHHSGN